MTSWATKDDFYADLVKLTNFHSESDNISPTAYENNNSTKSERWYDSESDDEDYIDSTQSSDGTDHLQICHDVHRQVRSTVGNCYNNDLIEKFYQNMPRRPGTQSTENQSSRGSSPKQTMDIATTIAKSLERFARPETSKVDEDGMFANGPMNQEKAKNKRKPKPSNESKSINLKSHTDFPSL